MQKLRAIVEQIENGRASLVLEDGVRLQFPLDKLPSGISEGTFLQIAISVDRIAAFLHQPFIPKEAKI